MSSGLNKDSKQQDLNRSEESEILADAMMDEDVIAAYLESHPDFFNRHADLLATLQVPHQAGTASLIERQVAVLREKSRDLEEQLNGLVRTARGNEQIVTRLQRFTLELMRSEGLDDLIGTCQDVLRDDFNADFVSVRVIDHAQADKKPSKQTKNKTQRLHFIAADDPDLKQFERLFDSKKPVCGRLRDAQQVFLFDDNADAVKSVALIPLVGAEPLGLLALGSRDEKRFHPGMGTVFIRHLGELISTSLIRAMKQA